MVWTGGSVDDAMFRRTGPAAEQGDKREGGDLREVVVVCRLAALGLFFSLQDTPTQALKLPGPRAQPAILQRLAGMPGSGTQGRIPGMEAWKAYLV